MKDLVLTNFSFTKEIKNISCSDFLSGFYYSALINRLPVVLWRLPGQNENYGMVDFSGNVFFSKINFDENQEGFAFSPFRNDTGISTIFIKSHMLLNCSKRIFIDSKNILNDIENNNRSKFFETFNKIANSKDYLESFGKHYISAIKDNPVIYSRDEFCDLVKHAVRHIKESNVKKIVLSRITKVQISNDFDPVAFFETLAEKYNGALVSLVSIPGIGTWIGATPETLVSIKENELRTEALAGTQAIKQDTDLSKIFWNEKEREEQILVVQYIREIFSESERSDFFEEEPKTVQAGNVAHLKTKFRLLLKDNNYKIFAEKFLEGLHPTPAVCGLAKKEALSFIMEHETHNREFYSGFLGPVNINNESHLFVNLRCMKIIENSAVLFIGCGITEGSVPESEWEETELKADTLLSVINGNG